ncbi:hypothetical protein N5U00_08045 [Aliarcobacter butzleri]|uniref:Lipoprotein n=1 Tax=Aliarcobacter butzleri L352 TaxID=1447260 RepID=A0A837JEZ4_9BACT|nr:hypothetical protein [Aliarcobacter butzleri]KLE04212.1 hypothetical protein AF78_08985 [Aliarcobacter butzleri L353]KLE06332.1 hypothetical protein AF77_02380 [Aliarcobacter butzleri L352]MCT7566873.1 hypothetical protein [Aliarcobacter butzleri]MCT7575278.1 hypothetical protein [Aliarcobacter butzleri]MCT7611739.1 hypothetical protein [Aliarcobacter butzleri]
MKKTVNLILLGIVIFGFSGCFLTPYDNEFKCQPSIIGRCTSSIVDTYNESIQEIDSNKDNK